MDRSARRRRRGPWRILWILRFLFSLAPGFLWHHDSWCAPWSWRWDLRSGKKSGLGSRLSRIRPCLDRLHRMACPLLKKPYVSVLPREHAHASESKARDDGLGRAGRILVWARTIIDLPIVDSRPSALLHPNRPVTYDSVSFSLGRVNISAVGPNSMSRPRYIKAV